MTPLSYQQIICLERTRDAGGLRYVRGGFWVEATTDPEAFLAFSWADQDKRPWYAPTVTVKSLVKRGLLVWADTIESARFGYPVKAVLSPEPEDRKVQTPETPVEDLMLPFCACGRPWSQCDGSRVGCHKR